MSRCPLRWLSLLPALGVFSLAACEGARQPNDAAAPNGAATSESRPLNVFIADKSLEVSSLLEAYRAETGVDAVLATAGSAGDAQADIVLARGFVQLWELAESGELRPLAGMPLDNPVNALLGDPESRWVVIGRRLRVVVYDARRVTRGELQAVKDYASLGSPAWQGRLCLSSSAAPGNRLLVSHLIRRHQLREAEIIVRRWLANLAVPELPGDEELLDAIEAGRCQVGIADSAAFAGRVAATTLRAHIFEGSGEILADASGAGVGRHAGQPEAASAFIAWLEKGSPNALYATLHREFPADPDALSGDLLRDRATGIAHSAPLSELGFLLEEADRLVERAGYR